MDDLCTGCLCADRKLYFIGETGSYHLYMEILNEIPIYELSMCVRVCWECRERLRRFREFRNVVKSSYTRLLQHQHEAPQETLARPPRLQAHSLAGYWLPDRPIKQEHGLVEGLGDGDTCLLDIDLKPLKEERLHSEPEAEAFEVEDIEDVEVKRARKKRTSKKDVDLTDLKEEEEMLHDDLEAVYELAPKKVVKKRAIKKTSKEKSKKVKSKSKKLEEKKINTKKKAEDELEASEESGLPYEGNSDGAVDFDDIEDDMVLEAVRVKKRKVAKRDKTDARAGGEVGVGGELPRNGVAPKGAQERLEERQPEMLGGKPKCPECGKVFSSKKTYRYHLNVLHKGQNRYPCPRCGKVYQWKSNLGRHMRTHKARDSGELYCALCDKPFASVATYRQHLRLSRRHVPETDFNFTCHECGKKFVNKTRLRDHVDWEHLHNIKFRCHLCNKPFKCHTSLYVHLQNVHRNKKKENLCHICGKSYQNAAKLKYHIVAMHTSETPYRCAQCAASFGWYSSLYRHVREVHYKMKLQARKIKKTKRPGDAPPLPPHELGPPPHPPPPSHL